MTSDERYHPTYGDALAFHAATRPDQPAIRYGDAVTTYAGYDRHVTQVANGLAAMGLKKGDRVAYFGKNCDLAVELALRAFRLAGVALEGEARQRFLDIGVALSDLSTRFGNAVLDATEAWSEHVTDEAALAGVPESDKAILAAYAQEKGLSGWLITLRQPSVLAILLHADDRALRERVYRAHNTRASDQSDDRSHDNSERIDQIMALRHEAAQILGFNDSAAHSLETKMAADADEALAFLADLAKRARPVGEKELEEARAFAAEHFGLNELYPWDLSYVAEAMRRGLI